MHKSLSINVVQGIFSYVIFLLVGNMYLGSLRERYQKIGVLVLFSPDVLELAGLSDHSNLPLVKWPK